MDNFQAVYRYSIYRSKNVDGKTMIADLPVEQFYDKRAAEAFLSNLTRDSLNITTKYVLLKEVADDRLARSRPSP